MTQSEQLRLQAAQAYQTGCGLARSGHQDLATKAFAESHRLVAEAAAAYDAEAYERAVGPLCAACGTNHKYGDCDLDPANLEVA